MAIREVRGSGDLAFTEVLRIAHSNFSRSFLEPEEELILEVDGRSRLPYRYLIWDSGPVKAFARFTPLKTINAGFIVHIAVDEPFRREGIGLQLLDAVHEAIGGREVPLLAEVEAGAPLEWWLAKAGAQVLSRTYTQPALHQDTEPQDLHLLMRGTVRNRNELIVDFYREVWELPPDHPYVTKSLAGVQ
jgi:GNAT superfamily N-acetyltransferase